jgi:hypothetical protein
MSMAWRRMLLTSRAILRNISAECCSFQMLSSGVQGPVTNLAREKRSRRRQAMPMKKKAAKKKKKH